MNTRLVSIAALLAAFVLFFAINILAATTLRSAKLDLTADKLYTLSPGFKQLGAKLDEPVTLTLYYSEKTARSIPQIREYAARVKDVLAELAASAHGKIILKTVDPEPYSPEARQAERDEVRPVSVGTQDPIYFGLYATNSTNGHQVISFFDPSDENFLEYSLAHAIYLLSNAPKPTIGLMSWLPIEGEPANPMNRQPVPPWQIATDVKDYFDVRTIPTEASEIPADVRVLMIVHPKAVSDATLYAIDQFVLKGGRVLVFVDPFSEADQPAPGANPMMAMTMPRNSDLKKLFDAWGVELFQDRFAADHGACIRSGAQGQAPVDILWYLNYTATDSDRKNTSPFNPDDPITGRIQTMILGTAGVLHAKTPAVAGVEITPLIQTTTDSELMDTSEVQMARDPAKTLAKFKADGLRHMLAARITGNVKTAFPAGKPAEPPPQAKPGEPAPPPPVPAAPGLTESAASVNIVVVADTDLLVDRFWVQPAQEVAPGIMTQPRKYKDNGDFVLSAIDNLSGSSDLLSIRARSYSARPFDRVVQLRKDAEKTSLEKLQPLEDRKRELQAKYAAMLKGSDSADAFVKKLDAPETRKQREEIVKEEDAVDIQLSQIHYALNHDIDVMGAWIKAINIMLVPALVGLAAIALGIYRHTRRRSARGLHTAVN